MVEPDAFEIDIALRYCRPEIAPEGAVRLFGELITPVISPWLRERAASGHGPELRELANLEPKRWLYFNYTFQQVQAALTGQGVALARLPLVAEALRAGELVEPFESARHRDDLQHTYWLISPPAARARSEVAQFCAWIEQQAALTREAIGETPEREDSLGEWD